MSKLTKRNSRDFTGNPDPIQEDPHTKPFSALQVSRRLWSPDLPSALLSPVQASDVEEEFMGSETDRETLAKLFPSTFGQKFAMLVPSKDVGQWDEHTPLRIGVVLSGGQAPGGHNVVSGIFDYVKQCNPNSQLFGFLGGPHGIFNHKYREIDAEYMSLFRNQGGFHMICSGRHKIETEEQKAASMQICKKLDLHGLIVTGGDDSNTNAAILAEYFKAQNCQTSVIGVPKTIDGDLRNQYAETSFGFDTAVKVYSELIGNLMTDVATSKNRYHFVRLMGRSASNIALECAMQTRPNLIFVGEEVEKDARSLNSIVDEVVSLIVKRAAEGKYYGVILLPEGLIEFIPEVGALIKEINDLVAKGPFEESNLSLHNKEVFRSLPHSIRDELLLERDPHGNVQVSKIATEKLVILMAQEKLAAMDGEYHFNPTGHFFGYEGRCAMPSNFDASYCYALGHTAAALVDNKKTAMMAVCRNLQSPVEEWQPGGCPLVFMMNIERRKGKDVPVIKKYLVDLEAPTYKLFMEAREMWKLVDFYRNPGPIQFEGPTAAFANFTVTPVTAAELMPPLPFNVESFRNKYNFVKSEAFMSPLQKERLRAKIQVTGILSNPNARAVLMNRVPTIDPQGQKFVNRSFPLQTSAHRLKTLTVVADDPVKVKSKLRAGIVLCGQQSPGIANIVHGLWERIRYSGGEVIGFIGLAGLFEKKYFVVTKDDLKLTYNQGGFELLGRTKEAKVRIRSDSGLAAARQTCRDLDLDGLVLIGGQTTMTDAAVLTEHLLENGVKTAVVGVPASHENNFKHPMVETCIGFDSATKCYSTLIGNLLTDSASATKYWYFIRLMGQVPSHSVLEGALQTHPNVAIISEKYAEAGQTLNDVIRECADVICSRAETGKNFGAVLVPEGLLNQLPGMRQLIVELNRTLTEVETDDEYAALVQQLVTMDVDSTNYVQQMTPWSYALLKSLPVFVREQLCRKTKGRIEMSEVSVEQLISSMVAVELEDRKQKGLYRGTFSPVCHYLGFQGRSAMPSEFDCALGLSHGCLAGILVEGGYTGYVTAVCGLCGPSISWRMNAVPLSACLKIMPERETSIYGRSVPMVPPSEVSLDSKEYGAFLGACEVWEQEDLFCNPGPTQYWGQHKALYHKVLFQGHHQYLLMLQQVAFLTNYIEQVCSYGIDENTLRTAELSLEALQKILASRRE